MFALALWDGARRRLVLARDRYGIKPLYWRSGGRRWPSAPSSSALPRGDARARRALGLPWLQLRCPRPRTIFRGVRKLPAGHVLVAEDGEVRVERCTATAAGARAELRAPRPAERCGGAALAARDSVRAHLVADVPVGVFLSGGVDSGALSALAARGDVRPRAHVLDRLRRREVRRARRRAPGRGALRHATTPSCASSRTAPSCCRRSSTPSTSPSPTRRRCRPTSSRSSRREDVKVVLSGEGGDELFGGYYTYVADLAAARATAARPARRGRSVERSAELDAPREPRLPREAVRARGAPAAARAPPRLEGDLLGGRARRADRPPARVRSGRRAPRALGRDARRRARSPACRTWTSASTSSTTCS